MEPSKQMELPLFRDDAKQSIPPYSIQCPAIKSGAEYFFETKSGLRYQVLFAKKKNSYLENIVNFSVLSDEFEDEYSETNRGRSIASLPQWWRLSVSTTANTATPPAMSSAESSKKGTRTGKQASELYSITEKPGRLCITAGR